MRPDRRKIWPGILIGLLATQAGVKAAANVADAGIPVPVDRQVTALAFSPDNQGLFMALDDGRVRLAGLTATGGAREYPAHDRPIQSLSVSRNGKGLLTTDRLGRVRVISVASGNTVWTGDAGGSVPDPTVGGGLGDLAPPQNMPLKPPGADDSPAAVTGFSSDTRLLAVGYPTGSLQIVDLRRQAVSPLGAATERGAVTAVSFSRSGSTLAVGHQSKKGIGQTPWSVALWDLQAAKAEQQLPIDARPVAVRVLEPLRTLLVAQANGKLRLYALPQCARHRILSHGGEISAISMAEKPGVLLSSGPDGLCVWRLAEERRKCVHGQGATLAAAALSPDGEWIASMEAGAKRVRIRHAEGLPGDWAALEYLHEPEAARRIETEMLTLAMQIAQTKAQFEGAGKRYRKHADPETQKKWPSAPPLALQIRLMSLRAQLSRLEARYNDAKQRLYELTGKTAFTEADEIIQAADKKKKDED